MTTSKSASLRAGAAQVDITPRMTIHLGGHIGVHRPAQFVDDPIYARALILESGGRKLCLLSLDLCVVTASWADTIRKLAADRFGFDREAVMVHALQLHSAPNLGYEQISEACQLIPRELDWLRAGDARYNDFAVERILEAVARAHEGLEPALIGAASGIDGRVAYNRRFVMRDGSTRTHPTPCSPDILHAEGPTDPEVGVVAVATEDMRVLAMLLHHTSHPCHGIRYQHVSADWPGAWSAGVRSAYGKDIVAMVLNGCCGNMHHTNPLDPTWVDDYRRMGRLLTETTHGVLKRLSYGDDPVLDWRSARIQIPIRDLDGEELEKARELTAAHPEPMWLDETHTRVDWDWVYAVAYLDLYERRLREPTFDYEIQVFRLGDIAIVGLPGELFVEAQLEIKIKSPAHPTYVAHNCNSWPGYIPTKRAFEGGGYETQTANWSMLVPGALEMITEATIGVLEELFGRKNA